MNKLVAAFPKNKLEEVRIQVGEFKGADFIDVRIYTSLREGEEKVPTGKGLSVDVSNFGDLKKAISELETTLRESRLIHE